VDGGTSGGATVQDRPARGRAGAPWVRIAASAAAVVVVLGTAGVLLSRGDGEQAALVSPPTPTPVPTCSTATKHFVPTEVSIPGVNRNIAVLPLAREASGLPGTPPLTATGKMSMAYDLGNGIKPGDAKGNALLNAHTYPDGSALGNKLLESLHKGDRIVVRGPVGHLCYDVTKRIEVPAGVYKPYFDKKGSPQIAIVVCSGKRLGPGIWTKRTIWFASPIA
jgi:hypothetical protein